MPSPTSTLTTLRPDLGASVELFDTAINIARMIGPRILPPVEVLKQAGSYGTIPLSAWLQPRDTKRGPKGDYARGNWEFTPHTYTCEEHGAEEPVDARQAAMYAEYFDSEVVAARRARHMVLQNLEVRIAAMIFNSGTFSPQAVTNEWDSIHVTDAVPCLDVNTAKNTLRNRGYIANALIISELVFNNLKTLDKVVEKIHASGAGSPVTERQITTQTLVDVFDLDYILVGGMLKAGAKEGQTMTATPVWDDEYAAVARIATSNDPSEPCIGRILHWGEDGSQMGTLMESYEEAQTRANIIRARMDTCEILIDTNALVLLNNITT